MDVERKAFVAVAVVAALLIGNANSAEREDDHVNSPYFCHVDFYNAES